MGSFVLLQNNFARKRSVTWGPYHEKTAPLDCAFWVLEKNYSNTK